MYHQDIKKVFIAILANSKVDKFLFDQVGHRRVLDHTIANCHSARLYSNKFTIKKRYEVSAGMVVPEEDVLVSAFSQDINTFEMPPYLDDLQKLVGVVRDNDYLCLVRANNPFLPPYIISKLISIAAMNSYDFLTNVSDLNPEGLECEVLSRKMLGWLNENASEDDGRKNLTPLALDLSPHWAKIGITIGHFDHSYRSYSVASQDDLDGLREEYEKVGSTLRKFEGKCGRNFIHRL